MIAIDSLLYSSSQSVCLHLHLQFLGQYHLSPLHCQQLVVAFYSIEPGCISLLGMMTLVPSRPGFQSKISTMISQEMEKLSDSISYSNYLPS